MLSNKYATAARYGASLLETRVQFVTAIKRIKERADLTEEEKRDKLTSCGAYYAPIIKEYCALIRESERALKEEGLT